MMRGIFKNKSLLLSIVAIVCCLTVISFFPNSFYNPYPSCDLQAYTFNFLHYDRTDINDNHYFNDRLATILPHFAAYKILGFLNARVFMFFLKYLLIGFSTFFLFKKIFNLTTGFFLTSLLLTSPILAGTITSDYPISLSYVYFTLALGFCFSKHPSKKTWFLTGLLYALALHANPKVLIYSFFIPLSPLISLKFKKSVKNIAILLVGSLTSTLILCSLSYLFHGNFLFFLDTIARPDVDIEFAKNFNSIIFDFKRDWEYLYNPSYIFIFASIPLIAWGLLNTRSKEIFVFTLSLLPIFIYHKLGGSTFGYKTSLWVFLIFLIFFSSLPLKMEKRFISLYFALFFISLGVSVIPYDFQHEAYHFFYGYHFVFFLFLSLGIIWFSKQSGVTHQVTWLLITLIMCIARPQQFTNQHYLSNERSFKETFIQAANIHDAIENYFEDKPVRFVFPNKDFDSKNNPAILAARLYSGCTVNVFHTDEPIFETDFKDNQILISKTIFKYSPQILKNFQSLDLNLVKTNKFIDEYFSLYRLQSKK